LTKSLQLLAYRAYTVVQVKELKNKTRLIQLKCMRGPYDMYDERSWIGNWSGQEEEQRWTEELMDEINSSRDSIEENHLQGLFWIQYEDLIKYFTTIRFCITTEDFKVKRMTKLKINSAEHNCFELDVNFEEDYYVNVFRDTITEEPQTLIDPYSEPLRILNDSDLFLVILDEHLLLKAYTKPLNNDRSGGCFRLTPGKYLIVPLSFKNFFNKSLKKGDQMICNLVVHSKQNIKLKKKKSKSIYKECINNLCYEYSKMRSEISNDQLEEIFHNVSSKMGNAFLFKSNPKHDVLFIAGFNLNSKISLKIKLKVKPNKYKCFAVCMKDVSKKESFEISETFTICYLGKHLKKVLPKVERWNVLEVYREIPPRKNQIICVVHRFIEDPEDFFKRHCIEKGIDAKDYEVQDRETKEFRVELKKAEFI